MPILAELKSHYMQVNLALAKVEPQQADKPEEYAALIWQLANIQADIAEYEDRLGNLQNAVGHYQSALKFYKAGHLAYPYIQNNLGTVYQALAQWEASHRTAYLELAITAFSEAIAYGDPLQGGLDYMMALNNMGNACWQLAQYEQRQLNLQRALTAFKSALGFLRPQESALAYATMQNNLGNIYQELAEMAQPIEHLHLAITAYRQALMYIKTEDGPLAWAGVQQNLGNAYRQLAHRLEDNPTSPEAGSESTEEEQTAPDYITLAIQAYQEALDHYTPKTAPAPYITTRANLGLAYAERQKWREAIASWHDAAGVAHASGALQAAKQYQEWIAATREALQADGIMVEDLP
jgi:tetratricopeptide (TPR) repeat protein